jgi:hypothetical protein
LSKEEQDFLENYIMNINTDGTEISGQMQAPILDMWKNKMTPEQMLYEYDANPEFERFKQYFKDSFIERLLKDMVY